MSQLLRFLPSPQFEAALAANAPTGLNPFATIADLPVIPPPDGNGIYDGSGSLTIGTAVTMGAFNLNFALTGAGRFAIGAAGFVPARVIHFKPNSSNGMRIEGDSDTGTHKTLDLLNDSGDLIAEFYNDSDVILSPVAAVTDRSRVIIGDGGHIGNARLTVKSGGNTVGAALAAFANSDGDVVLQLQNNGSSAYGSGTVDATTRLLVHGFGTTNLTTTARFEGSTGVDHLVLQDDGQHAFHAGGAASFIASFGSYAQSTGYSTGFAFYGRNGTTTTMLVQHTGGGASPVAINVAFQGAVTSGTATAIRGNGVVTAGATRTEGIHGLSRNGSLNSVGVYAQIGGGFTVTPSQYVAALQANASTNVDVEQRAGDFLVSYNNAALAYTEDLIAVNALASGTTTGAAGSTSNIIAGKFRTTGTQGTGDRIALLVPATNNNGTVVFGADGVSANASLVEVTGDIEVIGSSNGLILEAPDTTRYRVTVNNAEALVIAAA